MSDSPAPRGWLLDLNPLTPCTTSIVEQRGGAAVAAGCAGIESGLARNPADGRVGLDGWILNHTTWFHLKQG